MFDTSVGLPARREAPDDRHEHALRLGEAGYVHSMHSGSAVDGPGIRTVLWTTGCVMRCQYCHNPDTWKLRHGKFTTAEEAVRDLTRYARFLAAGGGGVTISGGEPLVQTPFVVRLLRACHDRGIHTALDTSGVLGDRLADDDLAAVDLVLLDLKAIEPELHARLTGQPVAPVLHFARRLAEAGKPVWVRHVLVPGLTDAPAHVEAMAAFTATLGNVERVEVLPFHQMGRAKWERLGVAYPLADAVPPSPRRVERVVGQFRAHGLTTF